MVSATISASPRRAATSIAAGGIVVILVTAVDWFTLRAAWLAEDAGPRFALAMTTVLLDVVRIGLLAPLVAAASRNVGLGVGTAASAATFFVWRPVIGTLPGTVLADPSQHTFLIPTWSVLLILTWTVALIGVWFALLWPRLRWPRRLRNATPFLIGLVALLVVFRPLG